MADIAAETKDAQLGHASTFLGLDSNRLCRWDQRTSEGIVEDMSLTYAAGKDYSRGTNFTCMATSGNGYVAVGSRDGRIRMYGSKKGMESFEFKQASTSVPGLGLPITAIDVSYDSHYIVATTDKYLIVLQTFFRDSSGTETNGFVTKMGAKTRPPKLLKLKPEDRVKVVCISRRQVYKIVCMLVSSCNILGSTATGPGPQGPAWVPPSPPPEPSESMGFSRPSASRHMRCLCDRRACLGPYRLSSITITDPLSDCS